ncbi:MAG: DUF1772 domain-containing protein [Altererythrobacter sp.]|nr:DUF1772 domain-containing protein [Altererythrobacter sp.]NNF94351.1 DUF1772 domain-containing protein [Altererythrobacter sp.]NNK47198.1 DUF1772 domain-containing protein [Altererythrobacter sp.]
MENLVDGLLWFTAISVGIMAGVYFTFSVFVMKSLDEIEAPAGMLAMQSINRVIVKSLFLPIFFASSLTSAALTVMMLLDPSTMGSRWALIGSCLYIFGMFVVTIFGNVPLNNRLESTDASGPDGAEMWSTYLAKWTIWNHVRTLACIGSLILLTLAISIRT